MKIDGEFKSLLPPLPEEDYRGLEESIKAEGCRDPLVVWGDILVDGHNRFEICQKNNMPFQTVQHDFEDRNDVILWIISNQLSRRNLTSFQRSELALRLKPVISDKAKDNQSKGGNDAEVGRQKSDKPYRTDEKLGEIAGVSRDTIRNTETILNKGTKEDIQEVRTGKSSISGKAKEIKEREKEEKVIEVDPEKEKEDFANIRCLRANLYEAWKTLRGTREMLQVVIPKQDVKELGVIMDKIWKFIERKGGVNF